MSRGGPRPDSGRKQVYCYFVDGEKFNSLKEAAAAKGVVTQTILRWCSGKSKKPGCWREKITGGVGGLSAPSKNNEIPESIKNEADRQKLTPLDYMLKILNDETEDKDLRVKCAYYALPYCHLKGERKGKKEQVQEKAKAASKGKFAKGASPLKVVR